MKKGSIVLIAIIGVIVLAVLWGNGVYNQLVKERNNVEKAWSNVESDYQRRYDLIGNLVATVDNAAEFERGTLTDVIEARSKATSINLNAENLTEQNLEEFQQAQEELNQAFLGRMNFLQENYPQLTATEQFRDLSSQIEGTENRINVSRNRFNEAIQSYNNARDKSPNVFIANLLGFERKASFSSVRGADKAPSVRDEFNK